MALLKYPNRRIYDTGLHQYITVPKLRERLLKGETVKHKTTGLDATAEVLAGLVVKDLRQGRGPGPQALRSLIEDYSLSRGQLAASGDVSVSRDAQKPAS